MNGYFPCGFVELLKEVPKLSLNQWEVSFEETLIDQLLESLWHLLSNLTKIAIALEKKKVSLTENSPLG